MECRVCGREITKVFFSFNCMPLSNSIITNQLMYERYYPLYIYLCTKCHLLMTPEFKPAKSIFADNYPYFSSFSDTWLNHCKKYSDEVINKYLLDKDSFVVEIGSNDGTLLKYFKKLGIRVLGIEPSKSVANKAIKDCIPTDIKYFDKDYALQLVHDNKKADLIIGNNVLAHNPDLHGFVKGLKTLLKNDGIITLEFPHLFNLICQYQFDTIYHEHFSYLSFIALKNLFEFHDLKIFDVKEIPTHGGSLRIYAKHKDCNLYLTTNNVSHMIGKELTILKKGTYENFINNIPLIKRNLLRILIDLKDKDKKIVGYGAPAKANTLLNYCGITTDFIDYTVDKSPFKQGKFMPGSHIPILSPDVILEDKPDYIIILPWNIKDEIIEQLSYTKKWNCKFIIPIPNPHTYEL